MSAVYVIENGRRYVVVDGTKILVGNHTLAERNEYIEKKVKSYPETVTRKPIRASSQSGRVLSIRQSKLAKARKAWAAHIAKEKTQK